MEVEQGGSEYLLTAEGQKLSCEGGRSLSGLFHLFGKFGELGLLRTDALTNEFAVPDDDAEEIVEVVRYAARQPPDGFHLSRHAKLPFENHPFRYVLGKQFQIACKLFVFGNAAATALDGQRCAV